LTLTLEVYEDNNTTFVDTIDAGQFRNAKWSEIGSQTGHATLTLKNILDAGATNPALALLETGRIIRFVVDGEPRFASLIEDRRIEVVSPKEEAGEITVVTGRGAMAILAKVCIRPDRGTGVLPWTDARWFNHSADRLRDDDAAGPQGVWPFGVEQDPLYDSSNYFGRPAGYVDTSGLWVAGRDSRTLFAPGGIWYGRERFTTTEDYDAVLVQFACDDQGELWLNGVPTVRIEGVYLGGAAQAIVPLTAGDHLVSVWVENLNELRTGAVAAIWTISDGMADTLLWRATDAMRVLEFPADPPGFTPTETLRLVVDESQSLTPARLSSVTFSFISASDTDHQELDEVIDIAVKAPANSILTLAEMLGETYLDIGWQPNRNRMDAWIRGTRGIDRTTTVVLGKGNCRRVAWDIGGSERATVAVVTGAGFAPFVVTHADAATLGVYEEVALHFEDQSRTSAERFANEYLDLVSQGRQGITLELGPDSGGITQTGMTWGGSAMTWDGSGMTWAVTANFVPYRDFRIGDTITIPGPDGSPEPHRIAAIGGSVGPDSVTRYEVDLDQPRKVIQERLDAIMRRQMPGAAGGRTLLPTPSLPSFPSQAAGSETIHTWQYKGTIGSPSTFVLRKNGTAITGASVTASAGQIKQVTLTNAARRYTKKADKLTFTADGGDPSLEWTPPEGRWIQEFAVTADAGGGGATVNVAVV